MSTVHTDRVKRTPAPGGRAIVLALVAVVAAAAGVVAGVRWRAPMLRAVGMEGAQGASAAGTAAGPTEPGQLWTCSMHPQVIQDHPGVCPICHMELTPLKAGPAMGRGTNGQGGDRKVKYWWDPMMSPPYIADKPGKSPMGMDLVPVYEDERRTAAGAEVTIDPTVVQNMGVRTAVATEGELKRTVRLVGYLDEAQPNIRDVNLRVSGWVRRLFADTEGMRVQAGDPLFDLYSPELQLAIGELIAARRAKGEAGGAAESAAALYEAAARKLELWGLEAKQVETLARLDRPPEAVTFTSPIAGVLTEKMVVEGAAVTAGERVMRVVDYSTLWLDARVFERDLSLVQVGKAARASVASRPGEAFEGEIVFIDPRVDAMTRTGMVRLSVPNPGGGLRPGMYATVRVEAAGERAVLVPREAVIDTGEKQIVLVATALPLGRFEPRNVRMGLSSDDGMVALLEGVSAGETVVTSGQFLIDSESRLKEAIQKYLSQKRAPAAPPVKGLGALEMTPEHRERVDALVSAYLELSAVLGAMQTNDAPVEVEKVVAAAHAVHGTGGELGSLGAEVAEAAEGMKGHPIDHQREAFKALSARVLGLVERAAPSADVARGVFVMHCPMAPGDWMQRGDVVANPFYAAEMKSCGEVVKRLESGK